MPKASSGFVEVLRQSAAIRPNQVAIAWNGFHETYAQLLERVNRLSRALLRRGLEKGDRVAIISRNCPSYLEAEFALYQIGAVVVKINWRMTAPEIGYIIRKNRVKAIFYGAGLMTAPEDLGQETPDLWIIPFSSQGESSSPYERLLALESSTSLSTTISPNHLAFIVHTSGTTGQPKFVSFTHGQLARKLDISLNVLPFTPDTRFFLIEQLFHIACMRAYMTLGAGGTLVLASRFDTDCYLETVQREKVTASGMIPAVLKRILDHPRLNEYDLSSLDTINYSTCAMPYPLILEAMERLNCQFYQVYGMTELLGLVTVLTPEDHRTGHTDTVGHPVGGYEIQVVDDAGIRCPTGATGEVLLRGPVMLKGYRGNYSLSQEILTDGWYHTRDLGFLDQNGYLHICGRRDDLIISGGENIYPQEIIDVLLALRDDVSEAAVYGVPDLIWGQKVWAAVSLRPGSVLTEKSLRLYCREHLANYKIPKGFEFHPSLPKNSTGKVLVKQLARDTVERLQAVEAGEVGDRMQE